VRWGELVSQCMSVSVGSWACWHGSITKGTVNEYGTMAYTSLQPRLARTTWFHRQLGGQVGSLCSVAIVML
jgi:hypothetical protein